MQLLNPSVCPWVLSPTSTGYKRNVSHNRSTKFQAFSSLLIHKLIHLGHLASVEIFSYINDLCQGDGKGFPQVLYNYLVQPASYKAILSFNILWALCRHLNSPTSLSVYFLCLNSNPCFFSFSYSSRSINILKLYKATSAAIVGRTAQHQQVTVRNIKDFKTLKSCKVVAKFIKDTKGCQRKKVKALEMSFVLVVHLRFRFKLLFPMWK